MENMNGSIKELESIVWADTEKNLRDNRKLAGVVVEKGVYAYTTGFRAIQLRMPKESHAFLLDLAFMKRLQESAGIIGATFPWDYSPEEMNAEAAENVLGQLGEPGESSFLYADSCLGTPKALWVTRTFTPNGNNGLDYIKVSMQYAAKPQDQAHQQQQSY